MIDLRLFYKTLNIWFIPAKAHCMLDELVGENDRGKRGG